MSSPALANIVAAAVLTAAASACGVSAGDKAGGHSREHTLVLALEQSDPNYSGAQFASAVARRSGGSIRVAVSPIVHRDHVDFERRIVEDIRAHRADLGVVGARVWDTLGVRSFQALLVPFLVDSLALEQRVLESRLAPRMLAGVRRRGVVGIALLPGPVRMPFGYTRPLVTRGDYRGFRMGVYPGGVETATLQSLGSTTRDYLSLDGASREGAILNFWAIAGNAGYRGKTLATNVVFWTRPETVVMNRDVFQSLSPRQQQILRAAGRDAIALRLAAVEQLEKDALASICERKLVRLVTSPASEIAAMRTAVRPVYAALERDARTRELLADIRRLMTGHAVLNDEPRACVPAASTATATLEGAWASTAARSALLASGASQAEAATYAGFGTLQLNGGRWRFRGDHTTVTGTYLVDGDVLRLTMRTCTSNPCSPGAISEYVWSVYRDRLSLRPHPGAASWPRLVAAQSTRVTDAGSSP